MCELFSGVSIEKKMLNYVKQRKCFNINCICTSTNSLAKLFTEYKCVM